MVAEQFQMSAFEQVSRGRESLAPYACHADQSRGRLFAEPSSPTRTPFQRDRDRIIHSTAFRRLKHKTQVFVHHVGDHYRTRLTHSIEVAQIARSLARAFRCDEDLAESLALSHDFGHTPFGHAGEDELNTLMKDHGGFDHNAQSLKIVTSLEHQYADFDGLNLSWETLEGLVKHNGPVTGENVPGYIMRFNETFDLRLDSHASIEAQCAAVADDIAYNAHDLDDGLRARLFALDDLHDLPIAGETLRHIHKSHPGLEERRVRHEVVRRQITTMVEDVIANSFSNLERIVPESVSDVRECGETIVGFSGSMLAMEKAIKQFLHRRMYRAPALMEMRKGAEQIIAQLFEAYTNAPNTRPAKLQHMVKNRTPNQVIRHISDYIASMTDSFAIAEHNRLFDHTPDLG